MARFVLLQDLASAMAEFAPPGWCKLAIMGALSQEKLSLWSAQGSIRAYLPPNYLFEESEERTSPLPVRMMRAGCSPRYVIERYGLNEIALPNTDAVEVWAEEWEDEPKRIALGWHLFVEPWDWDEPQLQFEYFEIPRDYEMLFGFDDLHPEGEPDLCLLYDARFDRLSVELSEAEALAPMAHLEPIAFGRKSSSPVRKIGRPKGTGYVSADEPLVQEMLAEHRSDPTKSAKSLADSYAERAVGHGTIESKSKRLQRRLRDYGV